MPGGRVFSVEITGTFVATVTLQRSSGNENDYQDWRTYTAPITESIYDAQDNQVWYYRLIVKPGNYTSGSVTMTLRFQGGTTTGYVRTVEYTSSTVMVAEVIKNRELSSTLATNLWTKGAWNATDGFPSVVSRGYGRLWFGRKSTLWGSQSDNFISFEPGSEANQAIVHPIAAPAQDSIRWLSMLDVLCLGTSTQEFIGVARTTNEAVGPSNFQLIDASEEGGAAFPPVSAGSSILYVHKSKRKLMQFTQNPKALSEHSYISIDLTARAPELLNSDIVSVAVQHDPERRVFVVLASGQLVELLFRREAELDVVAWATVKTLGRVEDVATHRRQAQDATYMITRRRDSGGNWVRAIEKYGVDRLLCIDEYGHLDAAVRLELSKPSTVAEVDGTTGTVIVKTDDDAFVTGDVGAILWINGGRGTIQSRQSARQVTMTVTTDLEHDRLAGPGTWGFGQLMNTITGLSHLNGQSVRVFGDLKDLGTVTVASNQVTLPEGCSWAYVGHNVRSRWKSLKLSYGGQKGTALTMKKAIKALVLLVYRTGAQVRFGTSWSKLVPIKTRKSEAWGEPTKLFSGESEELAPNGGFGQDTRLHIEIDGPSPATISGYVPRIAEHDA